MQKLCYNCFNKSREGLKITVLINLERVSDSMGRLNIFQNQMKFRLIGS